MDSQNRNSRRNFLKKAGSLSVGVAGLAAISANLPNEVQEKKPLGILFTSEISGVKDRIERVKIATLGMQRYDWEQGTVAQAFVEMGETDLAISFARGAIAERDQNYQSQNF